mmetsp:Transcript_6537/g.18229  ORF Transcript_6537/g.18229 Transcript_6537/m.18229 type:complete len:933 (-) Transcript_6537:161-2959(-)
MAGKKKANAARKRLKAAIDTQKATAVNKFERASAEKGSRRKFPLLGHKQAKPTTGKKGSQESRSRKEALLIQYKNLGKSNSFVDRRFGEYDNTLTEEDKAIARLQKQRTKQLSGRFALSGGEEQLTHLGRALSEVDELQDGDNESEDDGDDQLERDIVEQFHFGGGEGQGDGSGNRSKKEVMEEIIAKSKAAKALKAQQKEEDATMQEELDADFKALLQSQALHGMVKKNSGKDAGRKNAEVERDAYDEAQRTLVFESRAQAGERVKSPHEVAIAEAQRLEKLERERLRRMHASGDDDDDENDGELDAQSGGFSARRKRQKLSNAARHPNGGRLAASGDADDFDLQSASESEGDDEPGSDDVDFSSALEARRQKQAAGDHELQQNFRLASAQLLMKYGIKPTGKTAEELLSDADSEEGDEEDGEEEDAEEEVEGKDDDSSGEEDSEAEESDAEDAADEKLVTKSTRVDTVSERKNKEAPSLEPQTLSHQKGAPGGDSPCPDLPYTIKAPGSYQDFGALVHGRSAEELEAIVSRIRVTNALALSQDNRRKLQVLYGILVQHFVILAGQSPLPLQQMDVVTSALQKMTTEVPFYAATVARARLEKMQQTLAGRNFYSSPPLPVRSMLFLKLMSQVFPVSDMRHPVLTCCSLIIGSALSIVMEMQPSPQLLMHGLFLSQLALHMSGSAGRICPEALQSCSFILTEAATSRSPMYACGTSTHSETPAISLASDLPRDGDDPRLKTQSFKLGVVNATLRTVENALGTLSKQASCSEMLAGLEMSIKALIASAAESKGGQLGSTIELASSLLSQLQQQSESCKAERVPLTHQSKTKPSAVKTFNPRFEDDYVKGRDFDPDREKAEERRLKKEVTREKRKTIRELRKDASASSEIRDGTKNRVANERHEKAMSAISWLQHFEADMKSGGQGGMHKSKKK